MTKHSDLQEIKWLPKPKEHDYPAAKYYLGLVYDDEKVADIVARLEASPMRSFKAKDIFRASGLSLLGVSNSHVKKNRQKIKAGEELSPILLVRDPVHAKVVIADGYHRVSAVYSFNEDADIPCKIVSVLDRNKTSTSH